MKVLVVQFEFECEDFNQVIYYFSQGNYNFVQLIDFFSWVNYNFEIQFSNDF